MDYFCDVCEKFLKTKSKCERFKSKFQKEFKHLELTIENPNINDKDEIIYAYIMEHNKK